MILYSFLLLYLTTFSQWVWSERLHEQIYSSINGGLACFRRLNGTHQAGCSSSEKGGVGVVHMVEDITDAQWLVFNASAGPYIAVVNTSLFHDVVEYFMAHPDNIAGVLLYDNATTRTSAFTQESKCPNEYYSGPGSQCSSSQVNGKVWNEEGTGLLRRDIPFPIFFLPRSQTDEAVKIKQCYERYNLDRDNQNGRPLCSIQLNSFMFAAVNTAICLRRSASSALLSSTKVCDPLGDHNVHYSLFSRPQGSKSADKPVILVTARIDAASLFDGVSPGAASSVIGMVTLVAAASTLTKMIPETDRDLYNSNVLWTFFNGEAFDYIGSQRVAYDISHNAWPEPAPIAASQIQLHVDIGQLGGSFATHSHLNVSWPLHAFTPNSLNDSKINPFISELTYNFKEYNMGLTPHSTTNLPPSSIHSFRRILKNTTQDIPELLLVDHEEKFTNMFYNSALDEYDKIGYNYHNISIDADGTFISTKELLANGTMKESDLQVRIAYLATAVSRALYKQVLGNRYSDDDDISASAHLVDEMLYCFLESQACRLLLAADYAASSRREDWPIQPSPLYVSVAGWQSTVPVFVGHILALLTGNHMNINRTACDDHVKPGYTNYFLRGWNNSGVCIETTMNYSQAVSPAFIIRGYDYSSGLYSTWTESVWRNMWARVFVSASGDGARAAAVAGVFTTLAAALLTYWLQKHSQCIFVNQPAGSIVNNESASGILRTVNC